MSAAAGVTQALAEGRELMAQRRPEAALAVLRAALAHAITTGVGVAMRAELSLLLADACVALGDDGTALNELALVRQLLDAQKSPQWLDATLALAALSGAEAVGLWAQAEAWATDGAPAAKVQLARARAQIASGHREQAVPYYQRARERADSAHSDEGQTLLAEVFTDLGEHATAEGELENAVAFYGAAVAALAKRANTHDLSVIEPSRRLAMALAGLGDSATARALFQTIADTVRDGFGVEHGAYGAALVDVATATLALGVPVEAEALLRRAQTLLERAPGLELHLANALTQLGAIAQRDPARAVEAQLYFHRALEVLEPVVGAEHPANARTLSYLAAAHFTAGELELAEPLAAAVVEIEEQVDRTSAAAALAAGVLGCIVADQGNAARARPLLERAIETLGRSTAVAAQLEPMVRRLAALSAQ